MQDILMMIGFSLIFFYLGFAFRIKVKQISSNGVEVEGVVFDITESGNTKSRARYPIIRFVTSEKIWMTEKYEIGTAPNLFKKGQKVIVVYSRKNPKDFFIKSKISTIMPILLIIIGMLALTIALYKLYIY